MSVSGKESIVSKSWREETATCYSGSLLARKVNPGYCDYTYGWSLARERRSEEVKAWKIIWSKTPSFKTQESQRQAVQWFQYKWWLQIEHISLPRISKTVALAANRNSRWIDLGVFFSGRIQSCFLSQLHWNLLSKLQIGT